MVSNFERIFHEISKEGNRIAGTYGLEPEAVVRLIMDIVDLEDRNRVKGVAGINQQVKGMIQNATRAGRSSEGA